MNAGDARHLRVWVLALSALLVSCADDSSDVTTTTTTTTVTTTTTTAAAVTTTTEPEIEIPEGIVAAMPTQNRVDVAKGQFQVKILNGTDERFTVSGVQFVWEGYTTPVAERHDIVVGGQRIDFPVKFPGATCVGDGTQATMPDLAAATARLILDDGSERIVPVFDVEHLARQLYLEDCERQMIDSLVAIELVDLHAVDVDGRPVTEGRCGSPDERRRRR